ncbi:MAG: CpaF family protein, partial [Lachnospiraceae bacterium]|nr:CpaF family protein [Lachnospiraceae bacterium]
MLDEERQSLKEEIRSRILEEMDISREVSDEEVLQQIREHLLQEGHDRGISPGDRRKMEREIFHSLRKLDVLSELLDEADVTEIMVNGPDQIFIEKKGQLFRSDKVFTTREKLSDV